MILSEILLARRVDGFFHIEGFTVKADRISTPGYGVLVVFEASKLDSDFRRVIGPQRFAWFPTAKAIDMILEKLDLSDRMTCDYLRNGKGWNTGPRPFKLCDFI